MSSCRRRPPLADLSNVSRRRASSPSPGEASSWPSSSSSDPKCFKVKPATDPHVGLRLKKAAPSSCPESCSDGERQDAAFLHPPFCRTPPTPDASAMEIDACTPRDTEAERPSSCSSKGGSFIVYSRRKSAVPSHLIRSCPPPQHHLKTRNFPEDRDSRRKPVKRRFSAAMSNESEGATLSRRHSLPVMMKKQCLPEDFVAAQRSHFAEVDAFELCEEEGDLSDEG